MKNLLFLSIFGVTFFWFSANMVSAVDLSVTSPDEDDQWSLGQEYTIEWTTSSTYNSKTVLIALVPRGPDCLYTTPACEIASPEPYLIADEEENDGEYDWDVPTDLSSSYQGDVQILVFVNDTEIYGLSDVFTLGSAGSGDSSAVVITNPSNYVIWVSDTKQALTWTGGNAQFKVTLEPYITCITTPCVGSPIYTIGAGVEDREYVWTVGKDTANATIPDGPYRLHVTDADGATSSVTPIVQISGVGQSFCSGREGLNIKYPNSPAVYFIKNCKKQIYASAAVFFAWGQSFSSVQTVPSSEIFENDGEVKLPSGILVKGSTPTVFLVESGLLRPFASVQALTSRGYSLTQIKKFSDEELSAYPRGSDLN